MEPIQSLISCPILSIITDSLQTQKTNLVTASEAASGAFDSDE
jgi:hypothetical protein